MKQTPEAVKILEGTLRSYAEPVCANCGTGVQETTRRFYPGSSLIAQPVGQVCPACETALTNDAGVAGRRLSLAGVPSVYGTDEQIEAARKTLRVLQAMAPPSVRSLPLYEVA